MVFEDTNGRDYNGQMNGENFSTWFAEQLLQAYPVTLPLILDNAPLHNVCGRRGPPTRVVRKLWLVDQDAVPGA